MKAALIVVAMLMALITIVAATVKAEPRIFKYNFTVTTMPGSLQNYTVINTTTNATSSVSIFEAGNFSISGIDFNFTYECKNSVGDFKEILTIREVQSSCQTDDLLSHLINTTNLLANNSQSLYDTGTLVLKVQNDTRSYLQLFTDCKEVLGQTSVRELERKSDLETCGKSLANATGEMTIAKTQFESKAKDLDGCLSNAQNLQKEIGTCRQELETKSGYGQYIFAGLVGAAICYFVMNRKNQPPELAQFPQG